MKRLTFDGKFCDIAQCRETYGGSFCENGTCSQKEVWLRLKAYEDTGLEPEQCENAKTIIESAFSDDTSKAERIRELLKADKEGRLVVLPCKVGDTVYCLKKVYDCSANRPTWRVEAKRISGIPDDYLLIDGSIQLPLERFNKTVFLTREEAEAALEAMKNE